MNCQAALKVVTEYSRRTVQGESLEMKHEPSNKKTIKMSNNIFRLLFDIKREVEGFHHSLHAVTPIRQMVWSMFSLRREETWRKQEGRKGAVLVIYYYPGTEEKNIWGN